MIAEDFLSVTACVIAEDNGYKYRWSIKCISETLFCYCDGDSVSGESPPKIPSSPSPFECCCSWANSTSTRVFRKGVTA